MLLYDALIESLLYNGQLPFGRLDFVFRLSVFIRRRRPLRTAKFSGLWVSKIIFQMDHLFGHLLVALLRIIFFVLPRSSASLERHAVALKRPLFEFLLSPDNMPGPENCCQNFLAISDDFWPSPSPIDHATLITRN